MRIASLGSAVASQTRPRASDAVHQPLVSQRTAASSASSPTRSFQVVMVRSARYTRCRVQRGVAGDSDTAR